MRFLGLSSFHPDPGISAWYEESAACQFPRIAARLIDTEHVLKLLEDYPAGLAQLQITDNMIPYHIISYHNIIYIYYLDKLYHSSIKVFFILYVCFFQQNSINHFLNKPVWNIYYCPSIDHFLEPPLPSLCRLQRMASCCCLGSPQKLLQHLAKTGRGIVHFPQEHWGSARAPLMRFTEAPLVAYSDTSTWPCSWWWDSSMLSFKSTEQTPVWLVDSSEPELSHCLR